MPEKQVPNPAHSGDPRDPTPEFLTERRQVARKPMRKKSSQQQSRRDLGVFSDNWIESAAKGIQPRKK